MSTGALFLPAFWALHLMNIMKTIETKETIATIKTMDMDTTETMESVETVWTVADPPSNLISLSAFQNDTNSRSKLTPFPRNTGPVCNLQQQDHDVKKP